MKKITFVWGTLLLLYCIVTYSGMVSRLFLPRPHELILAFRVLWKPVGFMSETSATEHLAITTGKFILAALIGGGIGIPLGFAKAYWKDLHEVSNPILNFLRAIPVTTLTSLFMLLFGYGAKTQIAMSSFRGVLDNVVGSEEGVRNCKREIVEAAMLDGATSWEIARYITSYLSLPYIFATAKASLSISFVLVSVGEQMGGSNGIGSWIRDMHLSFRIPEMWVGIILSGIVGLAINAILEKIRSHLITWE